MFPLLTVSPFGSLAPLEVCAGLAVDGIPSGDWMSSGG